MKKSNPVVWGLIAVSLALLGGKSQASPFAIEQRPVGSHRTRIRVHSPKTGQTIWMRSVEFLAEIKWSPDHRALALLDSPPASPGQSWLRLIVWRAGHRVKEFRTIPPLLEFDGIPHVAWSADNKRLLLLGARTQGSGDAGLYSLWCFNVSNGRARKLTAYADRVTRAEWLGTRRIRFWTASLGKQSGLRIVFNKKPYYWTCR
jgi:hypothetical protein